MILKGFLFVPLHYDLLELDHYLSVTEQYLAQARIDFEKKYQEDLTEIPPEEQDQFGEVLSEESWRYSEVFPRLLRQSFLVTAMSIFEYNMR